MDEAEDGDTILVDAGEYKGRGNRDITFKGKSRLTLRSLLGADTCTINLEGRSGHRAFLFKYDETPDTVRIVGFTIRNGTDEDGGAIKCVGSTTAVKGSPTIEDCVFLNCSAQKRGGAVYCDNNSVPTIRRCVFSGNRAGQHGGALALEGPLLDETLRELPFDSRPHPRVEHCRFDGNYAELNGGATWSRNRAEADFSDCQFLGNAAGRHGGGMAYDDRSLGRVRRSTISGNLAERDGGGVWLNDRSGPEFSDCTLRDNVANRDGGGASVNDSVIREREDENPDAFTGVAHFATCLIAGNRAAAGNGGGVHCEGARGIQHGEGVVLSHSAVTGNEARTGGGLAIVRTVVHVNNAAVTRNRALGQSARGGGVSVQDSTMNAIFSTLYGNRAEGDGDAIDMDSPSTVYLESTIVWPDPAQPLRGPIARPPATSVPGARRGSLKAVYCNVFGFYSGLFDLGSMNNIGGNQTPVAGRYPDDPLLLPAGAGDPFPGTEYVLRSDAAAVSPCKDRGRPYNVYIPRGSSKPILPWPDDITGGPRKAGPAPDIGAYEIPPPVSGVQSLQPFFVGSTAPGSTP